MFGSTDVRKRCFHCLHYPVTATWQGIKDEADFNPRSSRFSTNPVKTPTTCGVCLLIPSQPHLRHLTQSFLPIYKQPLHNDHLRVKARINGFDIFGSKCHVWPPNSPDHNRSNVFFFIANTLYPSWTSSYLRVTWMWPFGWDAKGK